MSDFTISYKGDLSTEIIHNDSKSKITQMPLRIIMV